MNTKIRTIIIALVAAGSITAGSVAPQADAATKAITASNVNLARILPAKPSTTPIAAVAGVAIWTTKFGTGPAKCLYPDGATAGEGEEATVMVFLDDGRVVSYNIVCGADGQWHGA
jgi:hypothetical protein